MDENQWKIGVEDLFSKFPKHMNLLKDKGCDFGHDMACGSLHLNYGTKKYTQVYPPWGGINQWWVGPFAHGKRESFIKASSFLMFKFLLWMKKFI